VQLANTDELALGGFKPKQVEDVDGILRYANCTIAALQKRAETIAQKKDAALLDDAADRVVAAVLVDEHAAADALLKACDAVLQADAAQKPALRLARTDAERVLKWTHRVRDAPEGRRADIEKLLLEAAKAVVEADEPKLISARACYEQLESSLRPRFPRKKTAPHQRLTSRSTRSTSQLPRSCSRLLLVVNALPKRRPKRKISSASSAQSTRSRRSATTRRPPWQCLSSSSPRKTSSTLSKPTLKLPCARSAMRASATRCVHVLMIYY